MSGNETTPNEGSAFTRGLSLGHLNPPDVKRFVQGLPRRLDSNLSKLDERSEVSSVVGLVTSLVDELDRLIERTAAAGYPRDTGFEPALAEWSEETTTDPDLVAARNRFDTASVQAARSLAGIPNETWRSDPVLLAEVRAAIGRAAATLRDLSDAVDRATSQGQAKEADEVDGRATENP